MTTPQHPAPRATHASRHVQALRSVALNVPDLARAEAFYTEVWRLRIASRSAQSIHFRASGANHHVLSVHHTTAGTSVRDVTLRAHSRQALDEVVQLASMHGGTVVRAPHSVDEPGGGTAVTIADPDGRVYRLVHGDEQADAEPVDPDSPIRLAHVVLNAHDVEAAQRFLEQVFDFSLSDRTRIMAFMRCNSDHHSIALGDTDNDALNHIAFLMPSVDAVMRGGGRMRDAGHGIEWGPGRHGPGNNAFNYFLGPFEEVIEYTADVQQIDDSYPVGRPENWSWPAGRIDQWGIGIAPTDRLKQAQRAIFFEHVHHPESNT